ncbi:uncharacterized protein LOC131047458 [Cryptomeria japonica]|uniref:uncharacterized protein LOC131047458 n=1 Tax=Cryptomeria japonica TaxID=3369 RepID=UPI0027D9E637|nr:uncharacterized protein LOC131047458 [Cryptomeria japonica]
MKWERPLEGWLKVNFDGASKGNPKPLGAGVIVRNWKGDTLAIGAQILGNGSNNLVEVTVALLAIRMCKMLGARKVHFKGDSLIIILALMKKGIDAWHLQGWIHNILEGLENFEEVQLSHIKRISNVEADTLSKWALTFFEVGDFRWEDFHTIRLEVDADGHINDIVNEVYDVRR